MSEPSPLAATRNAGAACSAYKNGDSERRGCQTKWCKVEQGGIHCRWCKCRACFFCVDFEPLQSVRSIHVRNHTAAPRPTHLAVMATYKKEALPPWLKEAPIQYIIVDKSKIPNEGLDASSYVRWIMRNYHRLPEWVLFMHLHEYHWHHSLHSSLSSMLVDMDATGLRFLNINHDDEGRFLLYDKDTLPQLTWKEHDHLRRHVLGLKTTYEGLVVHPPGSQFWVHRDRIRAHPFSYYNRIYETITDPKHPTLSRPATIQGYPDRASHDFFMEGYWHWIMGEPERYSLPYRRFNMLPIKPYNWTIKRPLTLQRFGPTGKRLRCDNPFAWGAHRCGTAATAPPDVARPNQTRIEARAGGV